MSHFNDAAKTWDNNPIHWDRSKAIALEIETLIANKPKLKALEYGAGTAILSFLLSDKFSEITLMDNASEMVKVMTEKVSKTGKKHLKPIFFDLEHHDYTAETFDIIYSQMVLHHVEDIDTLFQRFYTILRPGGYLVIADLFVEDGTFHDYSFTGHKGFDPDELSKTLANFQFQNTSYKQCYAIKRESPNGTIKEYPIFSLITCK